MSLYNVIETRTNAMYVKIDNIFNMLLVFVGKVSLGSVVTVHLPDNCYGGGPAGSTG